MWRLLCVAVMGVLSGCLATTDLASSNSPLQGNDKFVVMQIAELVPNVCTRYRYRETPEKKITGDMPIKAAEIKRLYKADGDWYKAEVASAGVWDNVYFNTFSRGIECGEAAWMKTEESRMLRFNEIR